MIYTSHVFLTLSCVIVHTDSIIFGFTVRPKRVIYGVMSFFPGGITRSALLFRVKLLVLQIWGSWRDFPFFCIFKWGLIRKWMIRCTFRICLIIWNCFLRFQEMTPIASINSTVWCFNRIWSVIVFFHYDSWFPSFVMLLNSCRVPYTEWSLCFWTLIIIFLLLLFSTVNAFFDLFSRGCFG